MSAPSKPAPAFTPGPWDLPKYATILNEGQVAVVGPDPDDGHKRIALVDCQTEFKRGCGHETECAERDANARLIAAAPEMYAALEGMVEFAKAAMGDLYDANELVADAIAALASARGEAEGGAR